LGTVLTCMEIWRIDWIWGMLGTVQFKIFLLPAFSVYKHKY
jgi:hypothetical protein